MSLFQKYMPMLNKRTGQSLALSTIRRRMVRRLKSMGYRIKRVGDLTKIVAIPRS